MATFFPTDEFPGAEPFEADASLDLRSRVLAYERRLITDALEEAGGNQRRAARLLGILPTTLHEKIKRLGLKAPAAGARGEADAASVWSPGPRAESS